MSQQAGFCSWGKSKINVTGLSFGEGKSMTGAVSASNCCGLQLRLALIGSSPTAVALSPKSRLGISDPTEVPLLSAVLR
jgi:hypothetical protein